MSRSLTDYAIVTYIPHFAKPHHTPSDFPKPRTILSRKFGIKKKIAPKLSSDATLLF